jgi:hypothetical protein
MATKTEKNKSLSNGIHKKITDEDAQLYEVLERSKKETSMRIHHHPSEYISLQKRFFRQCRRNNRFTRSYRKPTTGSCVRIKQSRNV